MSRFGCFLVAAILAGGATGCLLFTDPINVAPEVNIKPPEKVYRGMSAAFTATAQDHDQDPLTLTYEWGAAAGECPLSESAGSGSPRKGATSFEFTFPAPGPSCVWLSVTDKLGAQSFVSSVVMVENRPPMAKVSVVEPAGVLVPLVPRAFDLYSKIRLSGDGSVGSVDGDMLKYSWSLTRPDGTKITPPPCPESPSTKETCFAADPAGTYQVTLVVNDTIDDSPANTTMLTVNPDRYPCILAASPSYTVVSGPTQPALTYSVLQVGDDGDPFPAREGQTSDTLSFVWNWRLGDTGPFSRLAGVRTSSFSLPNAGFHEGDIVQLRAEYRDRIPAHWDLSACPKNGPTCAVVTTEPKCFQWVTWTIKYLQ